MSSEPKKKISPFPLCAEDPDAELWDKMKKGECKYG